MRKSIIRFLDRLSPLRMTLLTAAVLFAAGAVEYASGSRLSLSIIWMAPVALTSWYQGPRRGAVTALACALLWLAVDFQSRPFGPPHLYSLWDAAMLLAVLLVVSRLVVELKFHHGMEKQVFDTDPLTGLANRHTFTERVSLELERCRRYRHPFTVAYIDLDNFKQLNDSAGPKKGDIVLCRIGEALRGHLRKTDMVARLGADEFALLLSDTGFLPARRAIHMVHKHVLTLVRDRRWPLTFSIAMISCEEPMPHTRDVLKLADDIMYMVKKSGKNKIEHIIWPHREMATEENGDQILVL